MSIISHREKSVKLQRYSAMRVADFTVSIKIILEWYGNLCTLKQHFNQPDMLCIGYMMTRNEDGLKLSSVAMHAFS